MTDQAIETLFAEERRYPPSNEFAEQANANADIYDVPFEEFWEREGRERISWFEPFSTLLNGSFPTRGGTWGVKINVAYNCPTVTLKRGVETRSRSTSRGSVGERAPITYSQLLDEVVKAANGLRELASARALPSASTWAWAWGCRSRCSPARAWARCTRWCSVASPPRRLRIG